MKITRLWLLVSAGALLLAVAGDWLLFGGGRHGEFWWSYFPSFFALFGFIGCLAIIALAKTAGRYWLEKGENYYQNK